MKAPVWFLIGRVSDVVGGGGYHRAYLIDHFVNSFWSWFLAGTNSTANWMATRIADGGADITNQFVSDGVNAGLLGVGLSVFLIVRCFQHLGTSRRASLRDTAGERLAWSFSATLICSIGILFSVTYFDQMQVMWYALLAVIAGFEVTVATPNESSINIPADSEFNTDSSCNVAIPST